MQASFGLELNFNFCFFLFSPKDANCLTHQTKPGDFLLLSTDGLFDNLYEDEIAHIIDNHINGEEITSQLLNSTCEVLIQKACKAGIKRDDMLVILVRVN